MKTMRHVQTWLLITLLALSASNDVWGKRLETNWNGNEVRESQTQGNQRGYTDHEHLDSIGLIHMNGRVYEAAEVARGIATGEITGQEAVTGAVITAGIGVVGGAIVKLANKVTPPVVEEQIKDVVDKALRKNTDAQQNLSDKPTRTADAPDGRGGNNDVEVNDNVNGDATKEVPPFIFRGGGKNPGSLTPRPKDEGFLSARDALSNPTKRGRKAPLESGEPIQVIDTSKLPRGSVIVDGGVGGRAPGHVSIGPNVPAQTIKDAIVETIPKSATR